MAKIPMVAPLPQQYPGLESLDFQVQTLSQYVQRRVSKTLKEGGMILKANTVELT
jgi:hypothetical protein